MLSVEPGGSVVGAARVEAGDEVLQDHRTPFSCSGDLVGALLRPGAKLDAVTADPPAFHGCPVPGPTEMPSAILSEGKP